MVSPHPRRAEQKSNCHSLFLVKTINLWYNYAKRERDMEKKYGYLTLSSGEQEETLTVTACDKWAEKVTIPMRVDGLPVVGIGERAFADCSK